MLITAESFITKGLTYIIRCAQPQDAQMLAALRLQIDGETEFMDREAGEGLLQAEDFASIIKEDSESENNIFLVAAVQNQIVGYARCEGSPIKRLRHQTEFGVCVARAFWGHGIGRNLLAMVTKWADDSGLRKITLKVLAENEKAIALYEQFGFEREGLLRQDKCLSDGRYHDTVVMGRLHRL